MTAREAYDDICHRAMLDLVRQPREVVYKADPVIAALEAENKALRDKLVELAETAEAYSERLEAKVAALEAKIADPKTYGPGHHCYWTDYGERQKERA